MTPLAAQTAPKILTSGVERPASVIFIGNSFFYYNNSLHNHVLRLASAADPAYQLRATSVTISGSGADWHDVESYFRPNALGRYSFDADNNVVFNKIDRLFDLAIMMDCSQCPIHPQLKSVFTDYSKQHSDTVRRHGAKPVFFMSWAYADKPEMTAALAEAYTTAANQNEALVIPAGLAFARSLRQRPELILHASDKRHPSLAGAVQEIPGRSRLHRRARRRRRQVPADRGLGDRHRLFQECAAGAIAAVRPRRNPGADAPETACRPCRSVPTRPVRAASPSVAGAVSGSPE
jgi:hypothetical protein